MPLNPKAAIPITALLSILLITLIGVGIVYPDLLNESGPVYYEESSTPQTTSVEKGLIESRQREMEQRRKTTQLAENTTSESTTSRTTSPSNTIRRTRPAVNTNSRATQPSRNNNSSGVAQNRTVSQEAVSNNQTEQQPVQAQPISSAPPADLNHADAEKDIIIREDISFGGLQMRPLGSGPQELNLDAELDLERGASTWSVDVASLSPPTCVLEYNSPVLTLIPLEPGSTSIYINAVKNGTKRTFRFEVNIGEQKLGKYKLFRRKRTRILNLFISEISEVS